MQPVERPLVERGEHLERRHGDAPRQRGTPEHPPLSQQDEQAYHDAAEPVEHEHRDTGGEPDCLVRRPHLLVASLERFGHAHEWRDLDEPIAGDDEAHSHSGRRRPASGRS